MSPFTFVAHSYNLLGSIRWTDRRPTLERFFRLHRPDILCVQELTPEACELIATTLPALSRIVDPLPRWTHEGNIFWDTGAFELVEYGTADVGILEPDRFLSWARLQIDATDSTVIVEITMDEAGEPMGLRKDLHIKALTEVPEIRERWRSVKGADPEQDDVDAMFADFAPLQLACLPQYDTLLPGVAETIGRLQADGIKIGSTTGFTRAMVDLLEQAAAKQGYVPDASVAGDEVVHGARPRPFMVYRNLDLMDISPIQSVVKVDDTVSGVGEALEAGCWGVGVARYSNYMNVNSLDEAATMSPEETDRRVIRTRRILEQAGAHYVADSLEQLPEVIEDINVRLAQGEKP